MEGEFHNPQPKLELDLGHLVKRIKQREDQHRRFFEYNNKIHSRWNEIADEIFIHDEISKLKGVIQERLMVEQSQQELDNQLCEKYEELYDCPEPVILLMKRVTTKIVEISQLGLESLKESIQYYSLTFGRFKTACLRASSDAISCRPSNMIKIFSRYLQHKINIEAERLREITKCLELSDAKSLEGLKEAYYRRLCMKEMTTMAKRQGSKDLVERSDSTSIASIKIIKKEGRSMHSEKEIKIKLSKNEAKQREKQRKMEIKKLKKYVQSLCEVMDVNKEQIMEDIFINCKESESRRIYTQLNGRNKHNFSQIETFISEKANSYKEIPILDRSSPQPRPVGHLEKQLLFERRMSPQKAKMQSPDVIVRLKVSPSKAENRQASIRYTKRQSFNNKPRIISKHRKTVNNAEEPQPAKEKEIFQSEKQVQSQFVQINIKHSQPKQRLPEIYTRATSVDTVKILKKEAQLRLLKEQKSHKQQQQQLKIVRGANESSNQTFVSKKNFAQSSEGNASSNIEKLKGREKIETKIKLQLKTMGSNFFEEIGKRISKFCEMKKIAT